MTRIDGIVLLGLLTVDYSRQPKVTRAWQTAIADGVQTHEDRAALRPRAMRGITWDVIAEEADEAHELELAITTALLEGNAAAPLLGRGLRLLSTLSGTTMIFGGTPPVAGDWFLFSDPLGKFAMKVQSMAGSTATFTTAFPRTLPVGSMCWPIIFGRVSCAGTKQLSGVMCAASLTVTEPMGVGSRATQTCPTPTCPTPTASLSMCEPAPVLIIDTEGACGSSTLSWTDEPGVSWKVWKASASSGPWTLVDTVTTPGYSAPTPLRVGSYYSLTVMRGSNESDRSNAVYAAGVRLEKLMRVVQERYIAGGLGEITWYDRDLPTSGNPGTYPPDGYYDADIAADPSGATEGIRLQHVFDQLAYLATVTLDGSPEGTTTPTYLEAGAGSLAHLPYTVTAETLDTSMRALVNTLCLFNRIARAGAIVDASSNEAHPAYNNWKSAEAYDGESAADALAALTAAWGESAYTSNIPPAIRIEGQTYLEEVPPDSETMVYTAKVFRARGTVACDLTGMAGQVRIYMMCSAYPDGPSWEGLAPTTVDGKYHSWRAVTGGSAWESEVLNGSESFPGFTLPYVEDTDRIMGWLVGKFSLTPPPPILAVKETWTHKL